LIYVLACLFWLNFVVAASSPFFCHLIIGGAEVTFFGAMLGALPEGECQIVPSTLALTFVVIFGSLFAKVCC